MLECETEIISPWDLPLAPASLLAPSPVGDGGPSPGLKEASRYHGQHTWEWKSWPCFLIQTWPTPRPAFSNLRLLIDGNNWLLLSVYCAHLDCLSSSILQILQAICFRLSKLPETLKKKKKALGHTWWLLCQFMSVYGDLWVLLQTQPRDSCSVLIFVQSLCFKLFLLLMSFSYILSVWKILFFTFGSWADFLLLSKILIWPHSVQLLYIPAFSS